MSISARRLFLSYFCCNSSWVFGECLDLILASIWSSWFPWSSRFNEVTSRALGLLCCVSTLIKKCAAFHRQVGGHHQQFSNCSKSFICGFSCGVLNRFLGCLLRFDVDIVVIMSNMYTRLFVPLRPYLLVETAFIRSRSRFGASILPAVNTD